MGGKAIGGRRVGGSVGAGVGDFKDNQPLRILQGDEVMIVVEEEVGGGDFFEDIGWHDGGSGVLGEEDEGLPRDEGLVSKDVTEHAADAKLKAAEVEVGGRTWNVELDEFVIAVGRRRIESDLIDDEELQAAALEGTAVKVCVAPIAALICAEGIGDGSGEGWAVIVEGVG